MRLTRWEPFREMDELLKGFSPFLGRMPMARSVEGVEEFMPLADIVEREKEYLIKVDLPEVRKEEVKVLFDDGVLTIKGERKVEKEVKGEKTHRTERFFGMFERSFVLPDEADREKIEASFANGVLNLDFPKLPAAQPKTIEVKVK